MTKEQIAKLAKEAGFTDADENSVWITDGFWTLELERFAHLVYEATFRDANIAASRTILDAAVLQEREACAQIADAHASIEGIAQRIAAEIRGQG